jgi:hypothetical protein
MFFKYSMKFFSQSPNVENGTTNCVFNSTVYCENMILDPLYHPGIYNFSISILHPGTNQTQSLMVSPFTYYTFMEGNKRKLAPSFGSLIESYSQKREYQLVLNSKSWNTQQFSFYCRRTFSSEESYMIAIIKDGNLFCLTDNPTRYTNMTLDFYFESIQSKSKVLISQVSNIRFYNIFKLKTKVVFEEGCKVYFDVPDEIPATFGSGYNYHLRYQLFDKVLLMKNCENLSARNLSCSMSLSNKVSLPTFVNVILYMNGNPAMTLLPYLQVISNPILFNNRIADNNKNLSFPHYFGKRTT